MNDFILMIQTALDSKGIKSDYNKLKQMFDKDPAKINAVMDMSATKTQVNKFIKEYAPQLQKMFKGIGVDVNLKELESSMRSVFTESEKAVKSLANAEKQAYEMNKSFDKQRLADKNKMHLDEIQAYKQNEAFDKKAIADKKSLFIAEEQGYKTNSSLRQKEIAEQKKLFVDTEKAYKANDALIKKQAQERIAAENKIQTIIKKTALEKQSSLNFEFGKTQLNNNISSYLRENNKLSDTLKGKLLDIQKQITSTDKTGLKNLSQSFKNVTSEVKSLGVGGQSVLGKFKQDMGAFVTFLSAGTLLMAGVNTIRQLITTVVELDHSLVDLQQATGFNISQAKELLDTYIDLGQEMGATGTEVANAAATWLRQGKSIADTNTLIKDSMILSKVGQLDSATATQYLTSAMKGYGVEVSGVLGIVDKLSAIDLSSATDVSGLAEAMSRVSNMANLAGVNMDKLLSYLAVVGEVTQKEMASIGTSFQTMFARMGNIKIGKFVDDETGESLNDVEKVVTKLGIKLRDQEDSFRNFGDVLDDIGTRWNSYSEVEQNALGVAIAGTKQRENFTVLMTNYAKSLEYSEISANSAGTAMDKFSNYESSVEAKTKTLQASLQELSTDTLNSGVVKSFLDLANILVIITDKIGVFNIALVALSGYLGVNTALGLTGFANSLYVMATGMGIASGAATTLSLALGTILPVIAGLIVIKGVVALYDHFNVTLEEHRENVEKLSGEYNSLKTELEGLQGELETTSDRIDELNNKDSLTLIEQGEIENLKQSNKELENRITLLQQEASISSGKLNKEVVATFKSDFNNQDEYATYDYNPETNLEEYNRKDESTYFKEQVKIAEELIALGDKRTEQQQEQLDSIKAYTTEVGNRIAKDTESYVVFDEETKKQKQVWEDIIDLSAKIADPAKWKQLNFDEVFNSTSFASARKELEAMAKAGTLDESVLTSNERFKVLLTDTGVSASEVVSHIKALNVVTKEYISTTMNAEDVLKALAKAVDSLSTSESALSDLKAEVKEFGAISMDTVNSLTKEYPKLTNVLTDYLTKMATTEDVMNELSAIYQTDMDNWKTLMLNKYKDSEEFLKLVGGNNSKLINTMLEDYGIDLSNNRSYLQSKMEILNKYLGTAGGAWLKYYDIASGKTINLGGLSAGEQYSISKAAFEANQALATFNEGLDFSGIESNFKTSNGEFKTKKDPKGKDKEPKWLTDYNTSKDDYDHQLAMDEMTQSEYYDKLEKLSGDVYKKHKIKFFDTYRSNQEEIYKGRKSIDEENAKKALDDEQNIIEGIADKFKTAMSDIDNKASSSDKGSAEQFSAYAEGLEIASDEANYFATQIEKLNTKYNDGNISQEDYSKQLENLTSKLTDAQDAMKSYQTSMVDNIKEQLESQTKALEDAYDDQKKDIEDRYDLELDKIQEITDARIKDLNAQKKVNDYAKSITEKTDELSKFDDRIADLTKASKSGDREATAELNKVMEERKKVQDELDEAQANHKLEVEIDALEEYADNYEKRSDINKATDLSNAEDVYKTKLAKINELYKKEEELILHASEYTKSAFATAFSDINSQLTKLGASSPSGGNTDTSTLYDNLTSVKTNNTASSTDSAILALLSSGTGTGAGTSGLNKYISANYGTQLSYSQMASLASLLGIKGVTSKSIVGDSDTKDELLKKLKERKFHIGGVVDASGLNNKEGLALVKHGEPVLTVEQGKMFKEFVGSLKPLNNLVKLSTPNLSNIVTNNSSPTNLYLTVTGVNDKSIVSNINSAGNDLLKNLSSEIRKLK